MYAANFGFEFEAEFGHHFGWASLEAAFSTSQPTPLLNQRGARYLELWHGKFPAGIDFDGYSLGEAEIASQRQRVLRAYKHILMRFCRRTSAASIAGMARKRGCAATPTRIVLQIGSGTSEKRR